MKVTVSVRSKFHAFHLAEQLEKRGHLERLITGYPSFKLSEERLNQKKVKSIPWPLGLQRISSSVPVLDNLVDGYRMAEWFDRLASRHIGDPDILVAWSGNGLITIEKAKTRDITNILERGSSHIQYQQELLQEEYKKFGISHEPTDKRMVEKEIKEYEEADFISVPSQFVVDSFLEQGILEEKLIKVPYGVDLGHFKEVPKEDDVFRIIFVGDIGFRKGIFYLLKAFKELNLPNSELVLIGGLDPEFKPVLEQHCDDNCVYRGTVNHNELDKYYSNASVFVHPSIEEGLSQVQLEAMACGLPVVATTNTGGSEVIRDGEEGFIIPIRDVEAINEKIVYLFENQQERKEMGKSAVKRVQKFTWNHYGSKIVTEYQKVLREQ